MSYVEELKENKRKLETIVWLANALVKRLRTGCGDWDIDRRLYSDARFVELVGRSAATDLTNTINYIKFEETKA